MAYQDNDQCIKPSLDLIIWRYMNLKKFESLLNYRALFFCRADRFSDPFEGSIPRREAEFRIEDFKNRAAFYKTEFDSQRTEEHMQSTANVHRMFKKKFLMNCLPNTSQ